MSIAVCVIVKNEADSILEWGVYHHLIGFDALIVFDDSSTDETVNKVNQIQQLCEVIQRPYSRAGNSQMTQYNRVCQEFGERFDWIAFIDADEFIYSPKNQSIKEMLEQNSQASAVVLPWLCYGSSGHIEKPNGLVLESYLHHSKYDFSPNKHVKSIVRPSKVERCYNPHSFILKGETVLPKGERVNWSDTLGITGSTNDYSDWRVNHYFTKSKSHWQERMARGQLSHLVRTENQFERNDKNDIRDESVLAITGEVARLLAGLNKQC